MGIVPLEPAGTSRPPPPRSLCTQTTLISVGPYMLCSTALGAASAHCRACSAVRRSPPSMTLVRVGIEPGASAPVRSARLPRDGTQNQCVIRCSLTNREGRSTSLARGTTSAPPAAQVTNIS